MRLALPALVSLWVLKSAEAIIVGKQYYDSTLPCAMSLDSIPDCNKYPRNECCKSPELKNLILPFNTTRVPSSDGSAKARKHIIDHFQGLKQNWKQEIVTSQEKGYNFTNIIYSLEVDDSTEDQDSDNKFLMLSAHYDSKIKPDGFIGAIDSAAPCAMLLYAAQFIDKIWDKGELRLQSGLSFNKGIKIVFFDGEEAFETWSETDSLYGSRAVAKHFEEHGIMEKIDLMVLLDLLGSAEPIQIPNFYEETTNYYELFWSIESQYNEEYTKQVSNNHTNKNFFDPNIKPHAAVQDDHLPFLAHNVPVLHLIPSPFPSTWHTLNDNYDNLDTEVIHKWSILVCEFLLRYYVVN